MQKVAVFGSYVKEYITRQKNFPLPGQTLTGTSFQLGQGGKGSNQAVAAHKAGADVTFITKLGDDEAGQSALGFYKELGVTTEHIIVDPNQVTGAALILVNELTAQNEIVVVPGACNSFTEADLEASKSVLEQADIVLLQQEINEDAQYKAIDIAFAAGTKVIVNPAPARVIPDDVLKKIDIVTPNETEAMVLTGVTVTDKATAAQAARVFLDKGVKNVVITMGALGVYATDGKRDELLPRIQVDAIDTTGAGDAFNGGFVTALSAGHDLFTAIRYGNVVGALSVTKQGTAVAMPTKEEIDALYAANY